MGQWSSENTGGKWTGGATGPAVGATFKGSNRNGWRRWNTKVTVLDSQPGRSFSFRSSLMGIPIAVWSYDIAPTETGCTLTESWVDERPGWFKPVGTIASGVADRDSHIIDNMTATLDGIAAAAERQR